MDIGIVAQQLFNGLMLGVIYSMIAVGFSLFFGVLDVIKFSHGDVVTLGSFSALGAAGVSGALFALPLRWPCSPVWRLRSAPGRSRAS